MISMEKPEPGSRTGDTALARSDAGAFQKLAPVTPFYATVPIHDAFNWSECAALIDEGLWYLVVFRSVRLETADSVTLLSYDERAHIVAMNAPGFIHYFAGQVNEARQCISFCLWDSQHHAQASARQESHRMAARLAPIMYESYQLERYAVTKCCGANQVDIQRLN